MILKHITLWDCPDIAQALARMSAELTRLGIDDPALLKSVRTGRYEVNDLRDAYWVEAIYVEPPPRPRGQRLLDTD